MLRIKKLIPIACGIFLLLDISYSFYQHFHTPLGGDLAQIVVIKPNHGDYQVLQNPFGVSDESYTNPNRFFAHWFTSTYFKQVPLLLQHYVSPITSVYLAAAIAKTAIQIFLIYLMSVFISGSLNPIRRQNLLAAVLITPLFQTHGFNRYMGIIDQSIVYALFYALPILILLVFYLPFYRKYVLKIEQMNSFKVLLLLLLIPVLTLSGPLLPGIILIVGLLCLLSFLYTYTKQAELSIINYGFELWKNYTVLITLFSIAGVFSLYSLYIGQNNVLNQPDSIGLLERFSNIPMGLYNLYFSKLGNPILLVFIGLNYILIRKKAACKAMKNLLALYHWVFIFALIYLVLLPFGGYRSYRPNIVRYDTFLPISIGSILVFASSTFYLLRSASLKFKQFYIPAVVIMLLIFTNADKLKSDHFECEYQALKDLSNAVDEPYLLKQNCTVMEWQLLDDSQKSKLNAGLFYYWNITNREVLYFQEGN